MAHPRIPHLITLALLTTLVLSAIPRSTLATSTLRVIPVPAEGAKTPEGFSPPHLTYNGHLITLKAIARGFSSLQQAASATFTWDRDGDGSFAYEKAEQPRQCVADTPHNVTCYDLGTTVAIPPSSTNRHFNFMVMVTLPGDSPVYASYPVLLRADVPSQQDPYSNATAEPQQATDEQLAVMRAVALDDALWYLQKQMEVRSGSGAQIWGRFDSGGNIFGDMTAAYLWLAALSGHGPAYPPGAYDHTVNPGGWQRPPSPPAGFASANDQRYAQDPYAETSLRALNYLLANSIPAQIDPADEADDGTPPIPDTNDGQGLLYGNEIRKHSYALVAIAAAAPELAGTVAQVGDTQAVQGHTLEQVVQQMTDWLVAAQIDATTSHYGGWAYYPSGSFHSTEVASAVYLGLNGSMNLRSAGVYVNERALEQLASVLKYNQDPASKLARYWHTAEPAPCISATNDQFAETGDALLATGLLGWHSFASDDPTFVASDYQGEVITRAQARSISDSYLQALGEAWVSYQTDCNGWASGLFYNDGGTNTTPYLRTDHLGNTDALFSVASAMSVLQRGYGPLPVNGHDWAREFTTYLVRNQSSGGRDQPAEGFWFDLPWPGTFSLSTSYYNRPFVTAYAGLILVFAAGTNGANTSPVIAYALAPAAPTGNNGWYTGTVTLRWTVTAPESSGSLTTTGCVDQTIMTDQIETSYACQASSMGGHTGPVSVAIKRDATPPSIKATLDKPEAEWYNVSSGAPTISFTCDDETSGVAGDCPTPYTFPEGANQSRAALIADWAGNQASADVSGISVDLTPPVVAVTGASDGASYLLGSVPAIGCSTTDTLSGVAREAALALDGDVVGLITATCSGATDVAGNTGSASITYYVGYAFTGFFHPVANLPLWNSAKAGSAIPVKFSLDGNQGLRVFEAGYPRAPAIKCDTLALLDAIEETVSAGSSSLSYDPELDQYTYVWKTEKAWAGTCRQLLVRLKDGNLYRSNYRFTR